MQDDRHSSPRGYIYLFLSVLFNGGSVHLIDAAIDPCPAATVTVITALAAGAALMAGGWISRRSGWTEAEFTGLTCRAMWGVFVRNKVLVFVFPLLAAIGGVLINSTIGIYGPEMAAFLTNLMLVFLVAGGLLQGDRVSRMEWPAIVAVVSGAFLFSHRGGAIQWGAIGLMTVSMSCAAAKQLLVRRLATRESLPAVMTINLLLVVVWAALIALISGDLVWPDGRALAFAAAGGVSCSAIGMSFLYSGYRIVGVSRGGPLNAMRPLVVLLIGLALGAELPGPARMAGGVLILVSSALLPVLQRREVVSGKTTDADRRRRDERATIARRRSPS